MLATTISLGTWYSVRLGVDANGLLSATVNGVALPTLMPTTALASGFIAVATQNAEASFDEIVVSQP
jgi:hypothetical protein